MDEKQDESEVLRLFDAEERSYWRRLRDMCAGLMKPRDSLAYKEAFRELQRQWAPLLGVMVPVLIGVVMCSITIGGGKTPPPNVKVSIMEPEAGPPLDPIEPPPPPENIDTPDDLIDDVVSAIPSPPLGDPVPNTPPTDNPPVQLTRSPVVFKGIPTRGDAFEDHGASRELDGRIVRGRRVGHRIAQGGRGNGGNHVVDEVIGRVDVFRRRRRFNGVERRPGLWLHDGHFHIGRRRFPSTDGDGAHHHPNQHRHHHAQQWRPLPLELTEGLLVGQGVARFHQSRAHVPQTAPIAAFLGIKEPQHLRFVLLLVHRAPPIC